MAEPLNPTPQQQSEILMQALPHMLRMTMRSSS